MRRQHMADPFYRTGPRKTVRILEWALVFAAGRRLCCSPAEAFTAF